MSYIASMSNETQPPTDDEDEYGILDGMTEEEFDLEAEVIRRTAINMVHFLKVEEEKKAVDQVVFSLRQSMVDNQAKNPLDFSDILTTNARILNAGFEFYLDKAHESPQAEQKIAMAMKMQSQLARTIDTWRRLANLQNERTK